MVPAIIVAVAVWAAFFLGYGMVMDVNPLEISINEYYHQYMIVGGVLCFIALGCFYQWHNTCKNFDFIVNLKSVYKKYLAITLVADCLGVGYMVYLAAEGAALVYLFTFLSGFLVYYIGAKLGTPEAGKDSIL